MRRIELPVREKLNSLEAEEAEILYARRETAIFSGVPPLTRRNSQHQLEIIKLSKLCTSIRATSLRFSAQITQYIEGNTAPEYVALCQHMRLVLPRELRDAVYEHLLADCEQPHSRVRDQKAKDIRLWDFAYRGMAHTLNQNLVGKDTLRELAEIYYRCSNFSFDCDPLRATYRISRLLFTNPDMWGCGVDVASTVRNLEFRVYDRSPIDLRQCYDLRSGLELLVRLENPKKINVSVQLDGTRIHSREL
jgi:hypothetical protein